MGEVWTRNAAGVKDGASCYRNIQGRRWDWVGYDADQLHKIGARARSCSGGGCFAHPDDVEAALIALEEPA